MSALRYSGKDLGDSFPLALAAALTAATGGGGTSSYVDVREFDARALSALFKSTAKVDPGVALTIQLKQATSSGGAGVKNVGGAETFTVADDGASPPGQYYAIAHAGVAVSDLDLAGGFYFVAVNIVGSVSTAGGVAVVGQDGRFGP